MRRLLARGVIRGFHADVDRRALGNGLEAIVSVRLRQHSIALVRRFHQHLHRLPEVVATYHLGGVNDYLVHVAVRDTVHLKELALEAFAARPEVTHMETALIFEHQVAAALQLAAAEEPEEVA
ncbi:MAG: Lrp/AsnC family transcriptional regulator [Candidatus Eisenbacteria bacterium]